MRKVFIFLLIILGFSLEFSSPITTTVNLTSDVKEAEGEIYQTTKAGEEFMTVVDKKVYKVKATTKDIANRIKDEDVVAVTVRIKGKFNDVEKILSRFGVKIISEQNICEKKVIYAYSKFFSGYNLARNKDQNIQIVVRENDVVVGIPLIVSGF